MNGEGNERDASLIEPTAERELDFVAGGPIPDSFFDALPDDELGRWDFA